MAPPSTAQDHGQPDSQPPTVAAFSPSTITGSALTSRQRSSVIVHRKSPLLVATPPAITRALAYSHPFLLPLNKLAGLLTWTSGDPWQSFLLVATFWTVVLHSDAIILWAGPILVVIALILGMYGRRYSPLSSTSSTGEKHKTKVAPDSTLRHQKSLDEIVETLRIFTTRCNILLEPLLDLTDFLSTQRTATSATTKPALTALFIRILLVTPVWIGLTLPPFYLITTRRVVMAVGTIILTYHSRPARVSRVILWRSRAVRRLCAVTTGLSFADTSNNPQKPRPRAKDEGQGQGLNISTRRRGNNASVRFTFVVYENQRRWLGIGWTYSLFPSERAAWTDEHMNSVANKDTFELPDVRTGDAKWRWVEGTEWRVEGADNFNGKSNSKGSTGEGWIYYDTKVSYVSFSMLFSILTTFSGTMAVVDKMDGTVIPAGASGTEMLNYLNPRRLAPQMRQMKLFLGSRRLWQRRKCGIMMMMPTPKALHPRPRKPSVAAGSAAPRGRNKMPTTHPRLMAVGRRALAF